MPGQLLSEPVRSSSDNVWSIQGHSGPRHPIRWQVTRLSDGAPKNGLANPAVAHAADLHAYPPQEARSTHRPLVRDLRYFVKKPSRNSPLCASMIRFRCVIMSGEGEGASLESVYLTPILTSMGSGYVYVITQAARS